MKLLNGDEIKLTYNLYSMVESEKAFGNIDALDRIFDDPSKQLQNLVTMIRIGANTTIEIENEVNGEDRKLYSNKSIALSVNPKDMKALFTEVMKAYTEAFKPSFESENGEEKN